MSNRIIILVTIILIVLAFVVHQYFWQSNKMKTSDQSSNPPFVTQKSEDPGLTDDVSTSTGEKDPAPISILEGEKIVVISTSPYNVAEGLVQLKLEEEQKTWVTRTPYIYIGDKKLRLEPTSIQYPLRPDHENNKTDIASAVLIAYESFTFDISKPYNCKSSYHSESEDSFYLAIDSCNFRIRSERKAAPMIKLENLSASLDFDIYAPVYYNSPGEKQVGSIEKIRGSGNHFVGIRITGGGLSSLSNLFLDIITNFGVENVLMKYNEVKEIVIGPEIIRIESAQEPQRLKTALPHLPRGRVNLKIDVIPNISNKEYKSLIVDFHE